MYDDLLAGLYGQEHHLSADDYDCLGIVETSLVSGALFACDRALKESAVQLAGIRVSGGLAGRAYYVLYGAQHDVEAGLSVSENVAIDYGGVYRTQLISRPHEEMVRWVLRPQPFNIKQ